MGNADDPAEQERRMLAPQLVDRLGTPEEVSPTTPGSTGRRT
jgi:hypothetical protein